MEKHTSEEILKQVNEEHRAYLRNTPVAANAFEAAFTNRARSGLLEELIERVLNDWLHEEMQNYDHRLTGGQLADFHGFAGCIGRCKIRPQ
ncbi:hypothetical protein [Halocynthiibacter namhaensis]|uniref:hypothetical protein n=1 Tax=Halocynthiibacter namhaensis TaxID=1290553 RepID=UPI0005793F64|nr:hypothetical protein [Halocynthiibacter namhaensis]